MEDRIKKVMSSVLSVPESAINEKTSPDTVGTWDSLKHMNLVVALEEEFGIQFDDQEMGELLNYQLIRSIIRGKVPQG
jgi:acyl carrier protein